MEIIEDKIIEDVSEAQAIACLLADDILFLTSGNISTDRNPVFTASLVVNANDIFMWGLADAEPIKWNDGELPSEVIDLYICWKENNKWGSVKWLCLKRNLQPQRAVIDAMKKDGYWPEAMNKLPSNPDSKKL